MKQYVITWAQNATPVHAAFFASLQAFCEVNAAHRTELLVIPGRYKNPTSRWSHRAESDDWWAPELEAYLLRKRRSLAPNLKVFADVSIQPTAERPLSGFEVFMGRSSGIFGHPKRALTVVPTGTRSPRIMWSTSACTVPNYTDSKAGKKGRAHHVLGALVVEVDDDGLFFCRHISADSKGVFTDLTMTYAPDGARAAERPLSATLGDWHDEQANAEVLTGTKDMLEALRPKNVVVHDFLDFNARNHHDTSLRSRYRKRNHSVESEVEHSAAALKGLASWGRFLLWVVRSNHDESFERWADSARPMDNDVLNFPYWAAMHTRQFNHERKHGRFPNLFELEARRLGVPAKVRFLRRNESLRFAGVEHGFHGDKGNGGSRGTPNQYAKLGAKSTTGHTHTPAIIDGAYVVGVTASLDHGYNLLPSTWCNAHVVLHADGKRQLLIMFKGRYRGGMECPKPVATRRTTATTTATTKPAAKAA